MTVIAWNKGRALTAGIRNGLLCGLLFGACLAALAGFWMSMSSWMHTHDYWVARQTQGLLDALVVQSDIALNIALFAALLGGIFGAFTGVVTGLGVSMLGIRTRSGFEWPLINLLGVAPIVAMTIDSGTWISFAALLAAIAAGAGWWIVRRMRRSLGGELPAGPPRWWTGIGYLLVLGSIGGLSYLLFTLLLFVTRF